MFDSIPVPLQAIFWPLLGAAAILATSRLLPGWILRIAAFVASGASLLTLWSLRGGMAERIELLWTPLSFFRMSPTFHVDALSLLVGILLAATTSLLLLGIRDSRYQGGVWRALILMVLAGGLSMTAASNLLTLALGSALLDLAILSAAVSMSPEADRTVWRMAVPGIGSTILLVFAAVHADAQTGTASLWARELPGETILMLGAAGVLRQLVFPWHPRGLRTAGTATIFLLSSAVGIYLLARSQTLAPVLTQQPWMLAIAALAVVAGGLLAASHAMAAKTEPESQAAPIHTQPESPSQLSERVAGEGLAASWFGIAIHQAGFALCFLLLVQSPVPWPLLGMTLALSSLLIWLDSTEESSTTDSLTWLTPLKHQVMSWSERAQTVVVQRLPGRAQLEETSLGRYAIMALPTVALASLAGVPLTLGARGRWSLYAILIHDGNVALLTAIMIADAFLFTAVWAALPTLRGQIHVRHPSVTALLAMALIALLLIVPGVLPGAVDLQPAEASDSPVLALGLLFVFPWLVGWWVYRIGSRIGVPWDMLHRVIGLKWLYRGAGWAGQKVSSAVRWLGQVGEGDGWWGWVLIILALGAMLLTAR